MYSKYFTCEGRLSKVHSGQINAQAAGMGEKMLEGKTLQQVRPELPWDIAGKHKHLSSPTSSCRNSIHQITKEKQVLTITVPTEQQLMQRSHNAIDLKVQGKATSGIPAGKGN